MRKAILIIFVVTLIQSLSYSQIAFEDGYFVDESGNKVECMIKNLDWKNNPTEFEYLVPSNQEVQIATIQSIKELGIYGFSKYVRAKVKIDRSGDHLDDLNSDRNPFFQEEILFLKVLIEGKATLYQYTVGSLIRFFYKLNDSSVNQLIYKRYLVSNKISENNQFRQQLYLDLKSEEIKIGEVERLKYGKSDLERIFKKYNEVSDSPYISFEPEKKYDMFNISVKPGLKYSKLEIENSIIDSRYIDLGGKIRMSFGIAGEFILPYNKNKWGLIIEPTYQYYKLEKATEASGVSGGILISDVNYKSIELPVGVRHYFFLDNDAKIFLNASYVVDLDSHSSVRFLRKDRSEFNNLEISSKGNLAFGAGYKFKNKFGLEIRYQTTRDILEKYFFWHSNFNDLSLIFEYTIF
ncbi:MAG TPA: porin family protein [Lentimicrobium sp.]|nr:porin family protein [Lentimicrobium sp.]